MKNKRIKSAQSSRRRKKQKSKVTAKPQKRSNKRPKGKGSRHRSHRIVVRSSGRREKFDTDRLTLTIGRSGVPFMMARDIANRITKKVLASRPSKNRKKAQQLGREVHAERIRRMVAQELRQRNRQDIAASYAGEMPENIHHGNPSMINDREPVLDNVAANRSRLTYDGTSRSAKSTKSASTK